MAANRPSRMAQFYRSFVNCIVCSLSYDVVLPKMPVCSAVGTEGRNKTNDNGIMIIDLGLAIMQRSERAHKHLLFVGFGFVHRNTWLCSMIDGAIHITFYTLYTNNVRILTLPLRFFCRNPEQQSVIDGNPLSAGTWSARCDFSYDSKFSRKLHWLQIFRLLSTCTLKVENKQHKRTRLILKFRFYLLFSPINKIFKNNKCRWLQ